VATPSRAPGDRVRVGKAKGRPMLSWVGLIPVVGLPLQAILSEVSASNP
jgi:hypothetical protein